ncbi:hypothetical protein BC629DRAFT_687799 [Irpex lacteus]|nr:hypothetical protein BC629DRAFT_687799 [Irpex lacteus]
MLPYDGASNASPDLCPCPAIGDLDFDRHTKTTSTGGERAMHAYASVNPLLFSGNEQWDGVQVIVPVGPIQISLVGKIEFTSAKVDLLVNIAVPLLPPVNVGHLEGEIAQDESSTAMPFEIPKIVSASPGLKLFGIVDGDSGGASTEYKPKFDWLCLKGGLDVYNDRYDINVRLLPFPVHHNVVQQVTFPGPRAFKRRRPV